MQQLSHLPIWREGNRLLLAIEQAVRRFPSYHKYSLGTDMRKRAMTVCRMILRTADKGEDQLARVCRVVDAVDDFKLRVHLGQERQAFTSFKQVQIIAELAVTVGRQRGSWRKRLTPFRQGPGFRASPDAMGFPLLSLSCKPLLSCSNQRGQCSQGRQVRCRIVNMKVRFSRHARRRAKLYRIPESSVEAVVTRESPAQGQHELVVDVPEMRYPLKIIVVVEDDVATVITNYPLKKAAAK